MTTGSLRERLRVETRSAILSAALDLFERNGYEQTTVEDIAAAAGISARTFFRYFDSKTEVVLHSELETDHKGDELMNAILLRPASESPSQAMSGVLRTKLTELFDADSMSVRQLRLVTSEPSLRILAQNSFHDHRPDLTKAFAARLGVSADDLGPRVLAAAFTEVIWVILERWIATGGDRAALPRMIDEAFASLDAGLT